MRFECSTLTSLPGISHGFFGRRGGKSSGLYDSLNCGYGSGDDVKIVEQNRNIVKTSLKAGALCTAYQIHSPHVITLDNPWHWKEGKEADALVTSTPGLGIAILTADCLPVLFADAEARVIGAAHAGWKGAIGGVIENTIAAMAALGAQEKNIRATIGPAIQQASYEVGTEFRERFLQENPGNAVYFVPSSRDGYFMFDLPSYAKARLEKAGITSINLLANDTRFEENAFFSYRRACLRGETVYGRQISAIVLDKQHEHHPF